MIEYGLKRFSFANEIDYMFMKMMWLYDERDKILCYESLCDEMFILIYCCDKYDSTEIICWWMIPKFYVLTTEGVGSC